MSSVKIVAILTLTLFLYGCDTASSSNSTSSIVSTSSSGSTSPSVVTTPLITDGIIDKTTPTSTFKTVTSARGDVPPAPPVIESN